MIVIHRMKALKAAVIATTMAAEVGASLPVNASSILIDDFGGGRQLLELGINPGDPVPQTAGGSFAYSGAIGGERDLVVTGTLPGVYFSGVDLTVGGFASFFGGAGKGAIIWDGTENDPLSVNFGLGHLDFLENCPSPNLHVRAVSFSPGADLNVFVYTSASDIAHFVLPLTTVGSFADYHLPLLSPTTTFGSPDFSDVNAISMFVDGAALPDLQVYVKRLEITCVPDGGSTVTLLGAGILGLLGVTQAARAKGGLRLTRKSPSQEDGGPATP